MASGNEIHLEENTHDLGDPHQNVTGSKFTNSEGSEKFAMDVKMVDTTDDGSDLDTNIRDIKLLLKCMVAEQKEFHHKLLTHLEIITNEENI